MPIQIVSVTRRLRELIKIHKTREVSLGDFLGVDVETGEIIEETQSLVVLDVEETRGVIFLIGKIHIEDKYLLTKNCSIELSKELEIALDNKEKVKAKIVEHQITKENTIEVSFFCANEDFNKINNSHYFDVSIEKVIIDGVESEEWMVA